MEKYHTSLVAEKEYVSPMTKNVNDILSS